MRSSKVLRKIRAGQVARVFVIDNFIPSLPRHAAHFGYDGIWVDGEHRIYAPREVESLIAFHHLADIDCIWRVHDRDRHTISRLLDYGATGIMVPTVGDAAEARQLAMAAKLPPLGERGLDGSGFDADFGLDDLAGYPAAANRETFLVVQIETPAAVENVDAIAAVPGVDILFIGPGDLSLRYGVPMDMRQSLLAEAQQRVAAAAQKHGKAWGRPALSLEDVHGLRDAGARLIVYGSQLEAMFNYVRQSAQEFAAALGEA